MLTEATNTPVLDQELTNAFSGQTFEIKDDPNLPPPNDFGKDASAEVVVNNDTAANAAGDKKIVDAATEVKSDEAVKLDDKSSLKPDEVKKPDEIKNNVISKSFEQLLEEKSEGKFKSLDDINKIINTNPFADEKVKVINDFVAQGGSVEDYYATQSVNFDQLTPTEILEYKIQQEDPDMTDEEVSYEIRKRYGVDNWKTKPEEYEEGIEPEDIRIAKIRFNREANKTRQELKDLQKEWAIPVKKEPAPAAKPDLAIQEKWNQDVKKAVESLAKVPLKITDEKGVEETFDYEVDPKEQTEISNIVNKLFTNTESVWEQFFDREKKTVDLPGIAKAIFFMRNSSKAMQYIAQQNKAKGAETIIKDIKNVDFKPEGKAAATQAKSIDAQIAEQLEQHMKGNKI